MRVVKVLPSREKAEQIRELVKAGRPEQDIVSEVFGALAPEHTTAVRGVAADPHGYHPDVDEVAVARALQGDPAVWERLTHYERREVMLAVWARLDLERAEDAEDKRNLRQHRGMANYAAPNGMQPEWLSVLADANGWDIGRLLDEARRHVRARVL